MASTSVVMFQLPCSNSPPLPRERTCCHPKPFDRAAKSVGVVLALHDVRVPLRPPQPEKATVLPLQGSQANSGVVHRLASISTAAWSVVWSPRSESSICRTLSVAARKERVLRVRPLLALWCSVVTKDREMFWVARQLALTSSGV
jgi:hypothetical protein